MHKFHRPEMKTASFGLMLLLSLAVAGSAIGAYGLLPVGALVSPEIRATFEAHRAGILIHVFGASVAMALGPFQFWTRLRQRRPRLHRWLGRLYLGIGVLVGGLAGLYMATLAWGGIVAKLGFGCLALAWLYTGWRAYEAARRRDFVSHRRWMIRNFALTFAAVMLRIYLPIALAARIDMAIAYPAIAWLCWVPNLVAVGVFSKRCPPPRPSPKGEGELGWPPKGGGRASASGTT
jgi:uncharacterized membrane protein